METATESIWTPDNSDQYALTQDMARTADDIDEAFVRLRQKYAVAVDSLSQRSDFFPSPVQGNRVWRKDLGVEEAYFGSYDPVSNPGGMPAAGWYPVGGYSQSPPPRLVLNFRRSDGSLSLNNGTDTLLRWESTTANSLGATVTAGAAGGIVTGLRPGTYNILIYAPISLAATSWITAQIGVGGTAPTMIGPSRNEIQSPPGFTVLAFNTGIYVPDTTTTIGLRLFSNAAGNALRADGSFTMIRTPYA